MRIAQIAPLYEAVPPSLYGGSERVVAYLTDALVGLGHDVTLFASGESRTRATLVAGRGQALRLDPDPKKSDLASHLNMMHRLRLREADFEVLHFHTDMIHFPFFEHVADRSVTTIHGRLDMKDLPCTYLNWPEYGLVSISGAQRRALPGASWLRTVQHGIPADLCRLTRRPEGYLAFLGRISPEKGPERAIEIARRAGMRLRIAAKVDAGDRDYFTSVVRPLLEDPLIEFIGEIGDAEKSAFLGGAAALLFPIEWPEPFGLVMIEAMACGTPVIAWNRASVPEVVDDGVTGVIVETVEEAVAAITTVLSLDRAVIRGVFEHRFTAEVMAERYVELYRRLLGRGETLHIPGAEFVT